MPTYMTIPQYLIKIVHGGVTYNFENRDFLSGQIIRVENGFDTATVVCEDYESNNFLEKLDTDDVITIRFKDASSADWTKVFDGVIRYVNMPLSRQGEILQLKCDGAGYGFQEMACGEEYGAESSNPTLDTLYEIITDATHGLVPKWVNKILGGADDSGYSYSMTWFAANDLIENIAGVINYLYFPYKPAAKALQDLCDVVQAIKGAAAGPHWIVDPNDKLIVTTVGTPHAAAVSHGYKKYLEASQAASTVTEGRDFTERFFEKLSKESNYVLYHGATIKPINLDGWTEGSAASWGGSHVTFADDSDAGDFKVGADSVHITEATGGVAHWVKSYYPGTLDAAWNINALGGMYNVPVIHFWSKVDSDMWNNNESLDFVMWTGDSDYYVTSATVTGVQTIYQAADEWLELVLPIGQYAKHHKTLAPDWFDGWTVGLGAPTWTSINGFGAIWYSNTDTQELWMDGIYIKGSVIRAAYDNGVGATDPVKIKVITDDVAKDDTWTAADDTGTIARLAYAELLRCNSTPYVGYVKTPMIIAMWPGQLMHVHAKKKADGTFNIDRDMRITRLIHSFGLHQGFTTTTFLTSDIINGYARMAYNDVNKVMAAQRPEFQDRQASSIKTRLIDVTQPILSKSY